MIGIIIRVESETTVQVVRVLPLLTLCRVDAALCELIKPTDTLPPTDRSQIPANAALIDSGEAELEARATMLCGRFGYKANVAETESGWGCWNETGDTLIREISVAQIDDLCKETYGDMDAFALLSGSESEKAYQWRCYRPA